MSPGPSAPNPSITTHSIAGPLSRKNSTWRQGRHRVEREEPRNSRKKAREAQKQPRMDTEKKQPQMNADVRRYGSRLRSRGWSLTTTKALSDVFRVLATDQSESYAK